MIRKWKNRTLPTGVFIENGYVKVLVRRNGKPVAKKQSFGPVSRENLDKAERERNRLNDLIERLSEDPQNPAPRPVVRWPFPYAFDEFIKHRPVWKYYRTQLGEFFGKYYLDELSFVKVEKYRPHRIKQGIMDSTVNREIAGIGAMYRLFVRLKAVGEIPNVALPIINPVEGVARTDEEGNRRRRIVTPEEFQWIMAEAPERLRRAILAAFNTGLRRKDVNSLDPAGNDKAAELLEGMMHKVGKIYRVARNDVMQALYDTVKGGVVIDATNQKKEMIALRKVCREKYGMDDFVFKDFRRSAAWYVYLEHGIYAAMAFLQHKRITTTQRYLGITSDDVRRAVVTLGSKFNYPIQKSQKSPKSDLMQTAESAKASVN